MDWKQILSQSPDVWTDVKKDEIYEQLIALKREKIEKKNLKKFFELAQHILIYKGEMVTTLLTDLEQLSSKDRFSTDNIALAEEIAELRKAIELADLDKAKYKNRIKELTDENTFLQRKHTEASNFGSGEDSPDVLSEIDRQEELLNNISAKNKHIKRLLRDIEALEQQTVAQCRQIKELQINLHEATSNLTLATNHLGELKQQLNDQSQAVFAANAKTTELQQQLHTLNAANYDRETEIQKFGRDIEERALAWKQICDEKDERLESLRVKYDDVRDKVPGYDIDAERTQLSRLTEAIHERDTVIADLEAKLIDLSRELMTSTDMMNKLARERELIYDSSSQKVLASKVSTCCEDTKMLLEQSTNRCKELQDIVTNLEEDNRHKAKQAMEAIGALTAYQAGEDGLGEQMKRNTALQNKIQSRDKQIRALVTEVNGMEEVVQENCVLRKRLGVPDDEAVSTKSYAARQRKFEKINEKLTLKLRASEEMRLQLKLEKNDLRRRINELTTTVNSNDGSTEPVKMSENELDCSEAAAPMTGKSFEDDAGGDIRFCENCLKQYNVDRPCNVCESRKSSNICGGCAIQLNLPESARNTGNRFKMELDELESRYEIVVEENENLRIGMHEILKKLRDYDAESENIIIDSTMLQQVLHALDARSISGWYHPAMRLQNELIASKERENALKERLRINENLLTTTTKLSTQPNVEEPNDASTEPILPTSTIHCENFSEFYAAYISSSASEIAVLRSALDETTEQLRSFELKCTEIDVLRTQIAELTDTLHSSDDEQELLLAKQYEEIIRCRTDLLVERKKVKFLHDDCHRMRKQSKADKELANQIQFEMEKELIENGKSIAELRKDPYLTNNKTNRTDQVTDTNDELVRLKVQLAKCMSLFVKHLPSIDVQNVLGLPINELEKYAVVDGKLAVELLAKDEYLSLKERYTSVEKHNQDLTIQNQHLTELLAVHRQQIRSQQQFLAKLSEDEISLRHLVVDMQSESNEKYIIAKSARELEALKCAHSNVLTENEGLQQKIELLSKQIETIKMAHTVQLETLDKTKDNTELKLRFLAKSHLELRLNYAPFMPLYPIVNFVTDCSRILELSATTEKSAVENAMSLCQKKIENLINAYADRQNTTDTNLEDKIKLLKLQSQCNCLETQLQLANKQIESLQLNIEQHRLEANSWSQHWQTIEMLFAVAKTDAEDLNARVHRETQTTIDTTDKCINTDNIVEESTENSRQTFDGLPIQQLLPIYASKQTTVDINTHKSMESQLKQAMILASTRSSLLLETENRLAIAQGRIKALERAIEDRETQLNDEREQSAKLMSPRKDDNVLSTTITSLQHLLQEKDTTLSRYQELLRDERSDRTKLYEDHRQEIRTLQTKIDDIEIKTKTKDRQIEQLREKIKESEVALGAAPVTITGPSIEPIKATTSDYLQLSDKHIEEMFLSERSSVFDLDPDIETTDLRKKVKDRDDDIRKLQHKLRDVSNREKMWEKTLSDKDREIESLNDKLTNSQIEFKDISENISTRREIEQLREMLEEKDRHINDLTDTLTHFHDDQQRFITDTSLHSAEQVSQLSSELSRSEATNRILNTQLEALKRQIANVCQREKQARDLVKTLKTQLIKRPVISVKTERSVSSREDHLQKRVHQLENEILNTKEELRKQTNLVQSRRTKDAAELGLWDKQKRFQQLSESLKCKLVERENELEKMRSHFHTAKTTIARLEREKNVLENRLRTSGGGGTRYCSSPSCPNLHVASGETKYTPAESPESYLMTHSDFGGGGGGVDGSVSNMHESHGSIASKRLNVSDANREIIDVLKGRIESQQRKIVAFELEGKGGNALTVEVEKLQEKLSHTDAQNLRLEAKNLQLQLDMDILRQGDKDERNRRQIKHLEDYIAALKSELTQAQGTRTNLTYGANTNSRMGHSGQMEQTNLSLRNVIERLKVENKNLKDGKKVSVTKSNISKEMYDKLRNEFEKLQQLYSDSLDKMSALQIELEIQNITCAKCKTRIEKHDQIGHASVDLVNELQSIKEKLIQKSQLLEKAKILLTRAAAKERNFREQIVYWKRRCSELQNVPVIDEE